MSQFSKMMLVIAMVLLVGLPVLASTRGWGLASETDAKIKSQANAYCPPEQRRSDGSCQRTHRSYYFGRSLVGGGPHSGK